MKAIVLTTINVPTNILEFVRMAKQGWYPIIVGDMKTPHDKVEELCKQTKGIYLSPQTQGKLGFKHMNSIPWDCYDRKNIGYLFAYKEGAEIVFSTDDDNYPTEEGWDTQVELGMQELCTINSLSGWWNCLSESDSIVTPRGYPYWLINDIPKYQYRDKKVCVGVQVGGVLGDPDVDAMTRMAMNPRVTGYRDRNVAVQKETMCPYNSQNTFISREMLPVHMLWCGANTPYYRFDDIFASYVAQVIGWYYGKVVKFGKPLTKQIRNQHNPIKDLKAEIGGMEIQREFTDVLTGMKLKGKSVIEDLHDVVWEITDRVQVSCGLSEAWRFMADTWCEDIEKIGG